MKSFRMAATAIGLATAAILLPSAIAPVAAAVDNSDPQKFVETLTGDGFAAMKTGSKATAKQRFRTLLSQNVAVTEIGDRLVSRWLPKITPEQKSAYEAALPAYIVGTYADRLFEYSDATVKVIRTVNTASGADVYTNVTKPGAQPVPTVWSLTKTGGGWKVLNLKVGGINVAMAQAADFDSVIQRQGFDALVKMMKARG